MDLRRMERRVSSGTCRGVSGSTLSSALDVYAKGDTFSKLTDLGQFRSSFTSIQIIREL